MTVAMPGLPLTSVLITSLFLQADTVTLMPLVIVAVVVSYSRLRGLSPRPCGRLELGLGACWSEGGAGGPEAPTRLERARS